MSSKWVAPTEIHVTKRDLIAKYHPDLALIEDEIAIIFKEKASIKNGRPIICTAGKATDLINLLSTDGKKWTFVITIGADAWQELNALQQVAELDEALCALTVEEDDKGQQKFVIVPPEVTYHRAAVERHGFWRTGQPASQTVIEQLFGPEDTQQTNPAAKPNGKKSGQPAQPTP